jgi:hypothetical protein
MVELAVVEAKLAITAPFCAPLLVEVVMFGVAAVGVVVPPPPPPFPPPLLPPLPHPHNKLPDMRIAASISCPARMFLVSGSRRLNLLEFRRNHETTLKWIRQSGVCRCQKTSLHMSQQENRTAEGTGSQKASAPRPFKEDTHVLVCLI